MWESLSSAGALRQAQGEWKADHAELVEALENASHFLACGTSGDYPNSEIRIAFLAKGSAELRPTMQ